MAVGEIMQRQVVTVDMDATLKDIQRIFDNSGFHHLVVTEWDKVVGVISDRDLLEHISPFLGSRWSERQQDAQTLKKKAHQIMKRQVLLAEIGTTAHEAARLMLANDISCLPVVDAERRLLGIVTTTDLLRAAYSVGSDRCD